MDNSHDSNEPVAWRVRCTDPMRDWVLMYRHPKTKEQYSNMEIQPLYTSLPAQRTWVGLTDEEICECAGIDGGDIWIFETAYAIEAKLREKNNG